MYIYHISYHIIFKINVLAYWTHVVSNTHIVSVHHIIKIFLAFFYFECLYLTHIFNV